MRDSAAHYYALHSVCHIGRLLLCEMVRVERRVNVEVGSLSFWNSDGVASPMSRACGCFNPIIGLPRFLLSLITLKIVGYRCFENMISLPIYLLVVFGVFAFHSSMWNRTQHNDIRAHEYL